MTDCRRRNADIALQWVWWIFMSLSVSSLLWKTFTRVCFMFSLNFMAVLCWNQNKLRQQRSMKSGDVQFLTRCFLCVYISVQLVQALLLLPRRHRSYSLGLSGRPGAGRPRRRRSAASAGRCSTGHQRVSADCAFVDQSGAGHGGYKSGFIGRGISRGAAAAGGGSATSRSIVGQHPRTCWVPASPTTDDPASCSGIRRDRSNNRRTGGWKWLEPDIRSSCRKSDVGWRAGSRLRDSGSWSGGAAECGRDQCSADTKQAAVAADYDPVWNRRCGMFGGKFADGWRDGDTVTVTRCFTEYVLDSNIVSGRRSNYTPAQTQEEREGECN